MKYVLIPFILLFSFQTIAQVITDNTSIQINKSWSQAPNGYTYPMSIRVPADPMPPDGFPICILLHGNGGNGFGMVNQFSNLLECHVLVAPTGYENSWNICGEESDAPDVEMVDELVEILKGFTNINPNKIRIIGSSNGAGLANNLFIQNDDPSIDIVCAIVSHLNEPQYHIDEFYYPSDETLPTEAFCAYNIPKIPLASRKYLSISNDNDPIIPYQGGPSVVGIDFLPAEEAAYFIALNQGYSGNQQFSGTTIGNPAITVFSYLSDKVVHIKGNANHGTNPTQRDYIKSFLSDCELVNNVSTPKSEGLKIYPNPTNDVIFVDGLSNHQTSYSLVDLKGQFILNGFVSSETNKIELSELSPGTYFLWMGNSKFKILKLE